MKKNINSKPVNIRRQRLERIAFATSNMKFACEFALRCMDLLKQAEDPELIAGLNKKIDEVLSALDQEFKEGSAERRFVNMLDVLGAIYLDQLDPQYTILARVRSFDIPGLLT